MKKSLRLLTFIFTLLVVLSVFSMSASAVTLDGGKETDGDLNYILSEDEQYYIVSGYQNRLPAYTIPSTYNGKPVKEIAEFAFHNLTDIISITISDSVIKIGQSAFQNCENLRSVSLSKNLKTLPENCFDGCLILKDITLPSGLERIEGHCFRECISIGKLKIPSSVTFIDTEAFLYCENILLDVSENEYAAQFAKDQNINTDFKNTTTYFLIILSVCIVAGVIIFLIIRKLMKAHIKKHPTHDPEIYIDRFFSKIGKGLAFIGEKISKFVKWIIGLIITGFEILHKKITEYRQKKKNAKSEPKDNEDQ